MINKSSLDLAFNSGPYGSMLDKNVKKINEQFDNKFIKEKKEVLKSKKHLAQPTSTWA